MEPVALCEFTVGDGGGEGQWARVVISFSFVTFNSRGNFTKLSVRVL